MILVNVNFHVSGVFFYIMPSTTRLLLWVFFCLFIFFNLVYNYTYISIKSSVQKASTMLKMLYSIGKLERNIYFFQ